MIEVIYRRTEHLDHYRQTCGSCKSDLRFTAADLNYSPDQSGRGEGSATLKCPVCNRAAAKFDYINSEAQFASAHVGKLETQGQYTEFQRTRILSRHPVEHQAPL